MCSPEQLLLASLQLAKLLCVQLLAIFISDLAAQVKSLHFLNFVLVALSIYLCLIEEFTSSTA